MSRERIIDQKGEVTGRISDTCRIIGFGLMIAYFTIILTEQGAAATIREHRPISLTLIGVFGVATILLDYLQYFSATFSVETALKNPEHNYDPNSTAYRARNWCFVTKQWTALIGGLCLIYVMTATSGWF